MHELARQLGCTWHTVWPSIKPLLGAANAYESRFDGLLYRYTSESWKSWPPCRGRRVAGTPTVFARNLNRRESRLRVLPSHMRIELLIYHEEY